MRRVDSCESSPWRWVDGCGLLGLLDFDHRVGSNVLGPREVMNRLPPCREPIGRPTPLRLVPQARAARRSPGHVVGRWTIRVGDAVVVR